jgi:hypothetical protein
VKRVLVGGGIPLLFLLCASCEKEKTPEPAPVAIAAPSAAPAVPKPTVAAPAPETVPVAADFEEEAEKTITKANYKTELDSLESELK